MKIGIDAISFDVPKIHLPIPALAQARGIEPEKLQKGLGLSRITMPDLHQDAVVLGANALTKLFRDHTVNPADIARLYVGTESSIDSSKPIASFLLALMEQQLGVGSLADCDAVDLTFACIGGVDALQNCLDFVRLNPDKKAIVVCTDIAKYDLASTGEYTQGAGAVALLVSAQPCVLAIDTRWVVDTQGVFDFFKPYRRLDKQTITGDAANPEWFGQLEAEIEIHKDQPVFDGQYSNQCYTARTRAAYFKFKENNPDAVLLDQWRAVAMHLPYAYQGRRMLPEIYALERGLASTEATPDEIKVVAKSADYLAFAEAKLAPAERASSLVGNLYTGSIFMALLSTLSHFAENQEEITAKTMGFMAYGSGSKSKVFQGEIQAGWRDGLGSEKLFDTLAQNHAIDFETYEKLHRKELRASVTTPRAEWVLDRIENENPNLIGARYYRWIP